MPGKDGTGPLGIGCGRGYRHLARMTGARGWMRFCNPVAPGGSPKDPAQEKAALEDQAKLLQNQLDQIQKRLNDIDH